MSTPKARQSTEMTFTVKVTVPGHMPPVFGREFHAELQRELQHTAGEVAKRWEGKATLEPKTTKQTIRQGLRSALAKAAQDYALELHRQWGMEVTPDDYWIGGAEEPAGAPYQLRTCYFISLDEMQYIIDHGILRDEYDQYYDYCQRLAALSLDPPTLRQWREHPDRRYAPAALERLQMMKDDLEREADRLKQSQQPSAAPAPEQPRPVSTLLRGDERLWDVALRGIGISMPDEYVMRLVRLAQKVHAFGLPSIHLDDLTEIETETSEEVRKRVAEKDA